VCKTKTYFLPEQKNVTTAQLEKKFLQPTRSNCFLVERLPPKAVGPIPPPSPTLLPQEIIQRSGIGGSAAAWRRQTARRQRVIGSMAAVAAAVAGSMAVAAEAWRQWWRRWRQQHASATLPTLPHSLGGDKDTGSNSNGGGSGNNQQSTKSIGGNGNGNGDNDSNDNDDENNGNGGCSGSLAAARQW
jgi:hypothetical protein